MPPRSEPPLSPDAPGVKAPLDVSMPLGRLCVGGISVWSRCVEDADDSAAESGLVGCFNAVPL